jgi:hypothetical protein
LGTFGFVLCQCGRDVQIDDGVAAQHDGGVVKKAGEILDTAHATRRPQGLVHDFTVLTTPFVAVAHLNPPAVAVAEVAFDFPVVVRHVDHDFAHIVAGELLDDEFKDWLAQDGNHGLGHALRERTNAGALACGQDHGFGHDEVIRNY